MRYFLLFAILFKSLTVFSDVSDFDKLKLYRSYYDIKVETPVAHQFIVWFQYEEQPGFLVWDRVHVAGQAGSDLSTITPEQYLSSHTFTMGYPTPTENLTPVPVYLAEQEEQLKAAIVKNHADLAIKQVLVEYVGHFARVFLKEYSRISETSIPSGNLVLKGELPCYVDVEKQTLTPYGGINTAYTILQYVKDESPAPTWLNFVLRKEIEGSSLITLNFTKPIPEIHGSEYERLKKVVIDYVQNPQTVSLGTILDQQGMAGLPELIKQKAQFRISIYGRTENWENQLNLNLPIAIPVSDKPFTITKDVPEMDAQFQIQGDLTATKLHLTVRDHNGTNHDCEFSSPGSSILVNGESIVINGRISFEQECEIKLPGFGNYQRFDVFPETDIYPERLTGL